VVRDRRDRSGRGDRGDGLEGLPVFHLDAAGRAAGDTGEPVRSGAGRWRGRLAAFPVRHLAGLACGRHALGHPEHALGAARIRYHLPHDRWRPGPRDGDPGRAHLPGGVCVFPPGHGLGTGCADDGVGRGARARLAATAATGVLLMPVARRALLALSAAAVAAIVLFPIYWMLLTALQADEFTRSRAPALLPQWSHLNLDAFATALVRKPVLTWLGNSMAVTGGATVLSLAIAALAGYSLSRFRSRAQQGAGFALLLSKMLPSSLIVIPFFIGFSTFGLIDSRGGLILANA